MSTKLKLRGTARFLASIFAGVGTAVRKDGLATYVDLDFSQFAPLSNITPANEYLILQSSIDSSFGKFLVSNLTISTIPNLTGEVTSVGNVTTMGNSFVIGKLLTAYAKGAGVVAATDSILTAIQKIDGNDALKLPLAGGTMSGNLVMGSNAISGVGALTATTINGNTFTAGTGILTIAAGKTATHNSSTTFAGVDGKTLTINNSLIFAGTDATTQTFPGTSGTVVTSVSVNSVTNAMRAQMAAFTLKGNNTGGTANEADIDVTALTAKASPVSADIVLIQDSAASFAFKKATVGTLASAGSVASIAGNTGAFTLTGGITNSTNAIKLALNNATFQSNTTGLNPTGTVSLTDVMMGMGATCTLTPVYSTRIKVTFTGSINSTGGFGTFAGFRFGTGTAPANAVAVTGTQVAATISISGTGTSNQAAPFTISVIITGLTAGTAYWFDLAMHTANAGNTASVNSVSCNAEEF